jgi:hypothetical protein
VAETIREFVAGLGFSIDEAFQRNFDSAHAHCLAAGQGRPHPTSPANFAPATPNVAQELGCEIGDMYLETVPPRSPMTQISVADQDFLQELFAALLLEGAPRQSPEEAWELAARLVTEARTPPDQATGVSAAAEALIRVRTLLRQRKR